MQQWRIFQVLDKNHELKEVPQKRLDRLYTIVRAETGFPALFNSTDGGALVTSFVEEYKYGNGTLTITTENSIYKFQTCDKEGNWC